MLLKAIAIIAVRKVTKSFIKLYLIQINSQIIIIIQSILKAINKIFYVFELNFDIKLTDTICNLFHRYLHKLCWKKYNIKEHIA